MSKRKSTTNPDYVKGKLKLDAQRYECIYNAREDISATFGYMETAKYRNLSDRNKSKERHYHCKGLVHAYQEGMVRGIFDKSFSYENFLDEVFHITFAWGYCYWKPKWTPARKYVRNVAHQKKSHKLSDKQAWREHKKLGKDKARPHWHSCKRKISMVRYSHRIFRRFNKRKIAREKWDDLGNMDCKFFYDPWLWD